MLRLSSDWYWRLDDRYRLVATAGSDAGDPLAERVRVGQPPWQWTGTDSPGPEFDRLRAVLLARESFRDFDITLRDGRGQLRYLVLAGEPLFDRCKRFSGYHGTARDLTERRRAESLVILEHAVTRSLAEASTSRRILQAVMRTICASEGWETGGYFGVEDAARRRVPPRTDRRARFRGL